MNIRAYRTEDVPYVLAASARNTWSILPADQRATARPDVVTQQAYMNVMGILMAPGGTALIAEDQGRPVGYLLVAVGPDATTGEPFGYMADIYVEPAYRRHGLGRGLNQAADGYLRSLGIRRAKLWTHAHNVDGQRSAVANGYRPEGYAMVKDLSAPAAGG